MYDVCVYRWQDGLVSAWVAIHGSPQPETVEVFSSRITYDYARRTIDELVRGCLRKVV